MKKYIALIAVALVLTINAFAEAPHILLGSHYFENGVMKNEGFTIVVKNGNYISTIQFFYKGAEYKISFLTEDIELETDSTGKIKIARYVTDDGKVVFSEELNMVFVFLYKDYGEPCLIFPIGE